MISNGFTYVAFLMCLAGLLLAAEKYTNWKVFKWVPPLVWIYVLNMFFCTFGVFNFADSCVTCGAIYLLLFQYKFFAQEEKSEK